MANPTYVKYLYQVVAEDNEANRKFAVLLRPTRVDGCSRKPLPQCSTFFKED